MGRDGGAHGVRGIVTGSASFLLSLLLSCSGVVAPVPPARSLWGFTEPSDIRSVAGVLQNGRQLDVVVTGWIALDSLTGRPLTLFRDTSAAGLSQLPAAPRRLAMVTSWLGQGFHTRSVRHLAGNDSALAAAAQEIGRIVAAGGYAGVVLDLEALQPSDAPALVKVTRAIAAEVRATGERLVAMAVPAADTVTYSGRSLLRYVDVLVVMLYDEHWAGGEPGPVASPEWARRSLQGWVRQSGAARLVAGFPLYGYHWRHGQGTTVSFAEADSLARAAGASLTRDPISQSLYAETPSLGAIWVSDVELLRRLMADAAGVGVGSAAFWYVGLEQPAFWTEIPRRQSD